MGSRDEEFQYRYDIIQRTEPSLLALRATQVVLRVNDEKHVGSLSSSPKISCGIGLIIDKYSLTIRFVRTESFTATAVRGRNLFLFYGSESKFATDPTSSRTTLCHYNVPNFQYEIADPSAYLKDSTRAILESADIQGGTAPVVQMTLLCNNNETKGAVRGVLLNLFDINVQNNIHRIQRGFYDLTIWVKMPAKMDRIMETLSG